MLLIGLTGSIASGKSFALQVFSRLRVQTCSADEFVHKILVADAKLKQEIFARFPDTKNSSGNVIRKKLAQHVYKNTDKKTSGKDLLWLEKLIHPRVNLWQKRYLQHCRRIGASIVVIEIPLLFEKKMQRDYHHIVMTFAPKYLRKKRVFKRNAMTSLQWRNISLRQMSDFKKKSLCAKSRQHRVIISGLGKAVAARSVVKCLYRFRNKTSLRQATDKARTSKQKAISYT